MKKAIVFGATGNTGIQICEELNNRSISHSAFVRNGSENKITSKETTVVLGSVLNAEDVNKAFESEEYTDVIIALGIKDLKSSGIRSNGTKNVVNAIESSGQKCTLHIISALGIGESWGQLKWHAKLISKLLINSTMKDHTAQEQAVIDSKFPYHIIRPVALKDGASKSEIHVQNEGFLPSNSIQRIDVAKFLVHSLENGVTGISGICQKPN